MPFFSEQSSAASYERNAVVLSYILILIYHCNLLPTEAQQYRNASSIFPMMVGVDRMSLPMMSIAFFAGERVKDGAIFRTTNNQRTKHPWRVVYITSVNN